ncbi:N-acetylmuramidase family protein [Methylobacterium sp. D54C]
MPTPAATAAAFARVRAADFKGRAVRLADLDLPAAGHLIGVGEDELHAVLEVETAGGGFDKQGRTKMLFEPHVLYRNLVGSDRARAVQLGIAYEKWRAGNYPADSYPRLVAALAINETAALKAASWGLGQILGENFVAAGYDSPQQMVVAFVEGGESEQLQAMVRFIKANRLDDELRTHNWAAFARGYNGPSYAQHGYHTKLAAAFAKWAKIKDTPWSPPQDAVGKPVPVPPVVIAPVPVVETAPVPPVFAPAPRNSGSPAAAPAAPTMRTTAQIILQPAEPPAAPAPAKLGFWASALARLRTAYPKKES